MPTPTYTPIASTTLSSAQASVTFSNLNTLAAGMRDLILVFNSINQSGTGNPVIRFNGDTGNNYSTVLMSGSGSGNSSQSYVTSYVAPTYFSYFDATNRFMGRIEIFDFAQTNKHKSGLTRTDFPAAGVDAAAFRWASTSAITSIYIGQDGANSFASGSTFSLFGVIA